MALRRTFHDLPGTVIQVSKHLLTFQEEEMYSERRLFQIISGTFLELR